MRSHRYLLLCLAIILCLHSVLAVPQPALALRRQDDSPSGQPSVPSSTGNRSSQPSATSAPSVTPSSPQSIRSASLTDASAKPSSSASTTVVNQVPNAASSVAPEPTSSAESGPVDPLPIHPRVTPAMGITGALLLITGLVYAVIGIKNKWIYVFGSAAYLTALAVVVLIVYLMNPPVSDGVQGAFFVAAFVTGAVFGGLSLVFSDITEGFGCLLGGFCLSMWLLSVRDGGLISSSTGRAIFIGCLSAGGFSLSFSRYTRTYGLIGSIAFSGATATILGIDCLACAGWKEFWLYLWNLNDSVFPLNTNTYPVTKNIKAELAGVVIIAVFGVVSQLRVWNLVKEHREKIAAQELEKQQEQDRQDEEHGRMVEDNFQRERAQWEAAYGDKSAVESSARSMSDSRSKGSTSVREKEVNVTESMEMVNLSKTGVAAEGTTVTVSVLKDDGIQQIDAQGNPIPEDKLASVSESDTTEITPEATNFRPSTTRSSLQEQTVPPPPAVIPLPFTIPQAESANSGDEEDHASISAVPESIHEANFDRRPISKRMSDMSTTKRFTTRASRAFSESEEALVSIPYIEEDRASSVAATLDEDDDDMLLHQPSPPHSPLNSEYRKSMTLSQISRQDSTALPSPHLPPTEENEANQETLTTTAKPTQVRQSLTTSTDPKPINMEKKRSSVRESRIRADTLIPESRSESEHGQNSRPSKSTAPSQYSPSEKAESHTGSLAQGVLTERLSKVAMSYRTNEWAKHLEAAEKPDLDEIHVPASPGVIVEEGPEEAPAPVSDEIASQLPENPRSSKRASVDSKAVHNSSIGVNRSPSSFSQASMMDQRMMARSPMPVTSPGILSRSNSELHHDALAPLPNNTLLGQRETLMRKRASSQSFVPTTSATNLLEQAEQENMSLAQRRQLLQNHQATAGGLGLHYQTSSASNRKAPPSASQKWQNKGWAGKTSPEGFDSHQPRRTTSSHSDQRREELYANWRDNIREVAPPQTQAYIAEQQRTALVNAKRQREMEKQQREASQQQRASMMDSMMRSGQMLDAHREAMRKMQANASRHAS